MGSIEGNSALTACQNSLKLQAAVCPVLPKKPFDGKTVDVERLIGE